MKLNQQIIKDTLILKNRDPYSLNDNKQSKYLKRIFFSGLLSVILICIIIYTLPLTVLSYNSLIEYAIVDALVIFLFILLIRYFAILIFAYLYINQYTFKPTKSFFPFVSIIVPVYNEEKVVADSVKSLLDLNYSNYEIIIVNDGSTDKTREVAQQLVGYQKGRYSDIKISLIDKPNGGKSKALNAGIMYSKADFVLCMDGDSQLSPDSLRLAVRHFFNPEIGAVAGNVKVMNRGKFFTDLQALEYRSEEHTSEL